MEKRLGVILMPLRPGLIAASPRRLFGSKNRSGSLGYQSLELPCSLATGGERCAQGAGGCDFCALVRIHYGGSCTLKRVRVA